MGSREIFDRREIEQKKSFKVESVPNVAAHGFIHDEYRESLVGLTLPIRGSDLKHNLGWVTVAASDISVALRFHTEDRFREAMWWDGYASAFKLPDGSNPVDPYVGAIHLARDSGQVVMAPEDVE